MSTYNRLRMVLKQILDNTLFEYQMVGGGARIITKKPKAKAKPKAKDSPKPSPKPIPKPSPKPRAKPRANAKAKKPKASS